ncbi:aldo/keto reductase [Amedibacillus sp. YH-ame10]
MKKVKIANVTAPSIIQGCMRLNALTSQQLEELILKDLEAGINFFDHADIYGGGVCEEMFGEVLKRNPGLREKMIIQSKCGIHRSETNHYDFSKDYILSCVDGILERLQCGYLDYLLLHRPDALVEPEEVGEAFDELYKSGKVRHFGVSNHSPLQIELLKKSVKFPIEINQMQMSIMHTPMIDAGINVNTFDKRAMDRDNGTLDYCRLHDITIQCWSPFQFGMFEGVFLDNEKFPEVNECVDDLAKKYGVSNSAIAVAWLLRHPANMQVILGSTNVKRIQEICKSCETLTLTREEWYAIYIAAGNLLP